MLRCPCCHQTIRSECLGIAMPPLKAQLVGTIKRVGDYGITTEELVRDVYRDRPRRPSLKTIKAHVWQVNELLEETNWIIRSEADYGTTQRRWYLRRRYVRSVA